MEIDSFDNHREDSTKDVWRDQNCILCKAECHMEQCESCYGFMWALIVILLLFVALILFVLIVAYKVIFMNKRVVKSGKFFTFEDSNRQNETERQVPNTSSTFIQQSGENVVATVNIITAQNIDIAPPEQHTSSFNQGNAPGSQEFHVNGNRDISDSTQQPQNERNDIGSPTYKNEYLSDDLAPISLQSNRNAQRLSEPTSGRESSGTHKLLPSGIGKSIDMRNSEFSEYNAASATEISVSVENEWNLDRPESGSHVAQSSGDSGVDKRLPSGALKSIDDARRPWSANLLHATDSNQSTTQADEASAETDSNRQNVGNSDVDKLSTEVSTGSFLSSKDKTLTTKGRVSQKINPKQSENTITKVLDSTGNPF